MANAKNEIECERKKRKKRKKDMRALPRFLAGMRNQKLNKNLNKQINE